MESTSSRCLHLAVTPAEYTKICGLQNLNPSVFSWQPVDNYLKISSSQEAAVHQALKSRTIESAKAALEFTTFYTLTLHLSDKQWCDLFMAEKEPYIIMAMGRLGQVFHLYGTLCIREVTKDSDWNRMVLCPTGIDRWADHALDNWDKWRRYDRSQNSTVLAAVVSGLWKKPLLAASAVASAIISISD